jgi:hypothetical protein
MNQAEAAAAYVDSEIKYLPAHFDEQTKELIRFMLLEAFNAGVNNYGYKSGLNRGFELSASAIQQQKEIMLERLEEKK